MTEHRTIRWLAGESAQCAAINRARATNPQPVRIHEGPHRWIERAELELADASPVVLKWYAPRRPVARPRPAAAS